MTKQLGKMKSWSPEISQFVNGNLPAVAILIDLWTLQYANIGIYRNYFSPTCPAWRTTSKEARDFAPELVFGPHMASQYFCDQTMQFSEPGILSPWKKGGVEGREPMASAMPNFYPSPHTSVGATVILVYWNSTGSTDLFSDQRKIAKTGPATWCHLRTVKHIRINHKQTQTNHF